MKKGDVNWEEFGKLLLWRMIVRHKNEDSGYDVITSVANPKYGMSGYENGQIGVWRFLSFYIGEFKPLTWKELALELGLFEEDLTPDGHDCKACPNSKECEAYFKDDPDHERCNWWEGLMSKNLKTEDGKTYNNEGNEINYETDKTEL